MQELEDLLLSTLSFYEPMSFSKIVFDMPTSALQQFPDFDKPQMILILNSLEKRGLVRKIVKGEEVMWQRIHKKRPFWKRILPF
jgi:hypothetical protein